jgi:hypothetical protein
MTQYGEFPYPTFVAVCTELIIGVLPVLIIKSLSGFSNRTA